MTGPRRGEMCGLRWDDVDLDAGRIAIRRQRISIRRQPIDKEYPKTGRAAVQTAVHALGEFHRVEVTDFAAFTLPRDDS